MRVLVGDKVAVQEGELFFTHSGLALALDDLGNNELHGGVLVAAAHGLVHVAGVDLVQDEHQGLLVSLRDAEALDAVLASGVLVRAQGDVVVDNVLADGRDVEEA